MSLSMQEIFYVYEMDTELVSELNFEISEVTAEKEKPTVMMNSLRIVWSCSPEVCFQKRIV